MSLSNRNKILFILFIYIHDKRNRFLLIVLSQTVFFFYGALFLFSPTSNKLNDWSTFYWRCCLQNWFYNRPIFEHIFTFASMSLRLNKKTIFTLQSDAKGGVRTNLERDWFKKQCNVPLKYNTIYSTTVAYCLVALFLWLD